MLASKVVVHDREGTLIKGTTADFLPNKPSFHVMVGGDQADIQEVLVDALKGVFFVKDFEGDPDYAEYRGFLDHPRPGKRVKAVFADGETVYGYAQVINYQKPGFFLFPSDEGWNNERIFAVFAALDRLEVNDVPAKVREQIS
jgi:hypothetical protein